MRGFLSIRYLKLFILFIGRTILSFVALGSFKNVIKVMQLNAGKEEMVR